MKVIFTLMLALLPVAAVQADNIQKNGTGAAAPGSSFTFGLFQDIAASDNSNIIFISPLSASLALSMTAAGADGVTRQEMLDALGFEGYSIKEVNAYNRGVMEMFSEKLDGVELNAANSVWISEMLPVKKKFVRTVRKNYDALATNLDFTDPSSPSVINNWCADNTAGRIDKMIERIEPTMMMYLLNALYFKGDWQIPFDPAKSREWTFHGDAADTEVKFMQNTDFFPYYIGPQASILELPYGKKASFVMNIILPAEGTSIDEFVAGLDSGMLNTLTGLMETGQVKVMMPAFKAEYETSLNGTLRRMGMGTAFTAMADFSGISKEPLMISDVKQKTFIEINEKGSEAAAVTSVSVMRTTALPPDYAVFDVDRPFVFLIRERATGVVLFLGLVRNL